MIHYKNYLIEPEASRYNLYVKKVSKKGVERTENLAWGITLDRCIEHIINGEGETDQTLEEYLKTSRELFDDIKTTFQ